VAPEGPARRDNNARLRGPRPEDLRTGAIELDEVRRGTADRSPGKGARRRHGGRRFRTLCCRFPTLIGVVTGCARGCARGVVGTRSGAVVSGLRRESVERPRIGDRGGRGAQDDEHKSVGRCSSLLRAPSVLGPGRRLSLWRSVVQGRWFWKRLDLRGWLGSRLDLRGNRAVRPLLRKPRSSTTCELGVDEDELRRDRLIRVCHCRGCQLRARSRVRTIAEDLYPTTRAPFVALEAGTEPAAVGVFRDVRGVTLLRVVRNRLQAISPGCVAAGKLAESTRRPGTHRRR
jgi:hypothetical protein